MGHIILDVIGVILLLAFISVSLAIRFKLMKYVELVKKGGEEPGNENPSVINIIRDTLRIK